MLQIIAVGYGFAALSLTDKACTAGTGVNFFSVCLALWYGLAVGESGVVFNKDNEHWNSALINISVREDHQKYVFPIWI